ncbi:MMPL family transporter [Dermatophilaceae bacterium Soc4.6]
MTIGGRRRVPQAASRHPLAKRYARFTTRRRWWIIGGWLVGLGLLLVAPPVATGGNELASIIPLDSPAVASELRSVAEFGYPLSSRTAVIQRDPEGLSPYVQAESVLDAVALDQRGGTDYPLLGALPLTNTLRLGGTSGETNTAVLTYLFMDPTSSFARQQEAAGRYIAAHLERPQDHVVGVAGSIPARAQQASLVAEYLPRLELLTVLAILLLVGVTFRSVLAPVIALLASGLSFVATTHLSETVGGLLGVAAPAELEPLLVALLLGVVTDYTIFYLTALRTRLPEHDDWRDAVTEAVAADTPIVLAAGITVAAGTAALLAANSPFFRGFGPAMALAVVVGLAVSVTLVPALLAILGPRVLWPGMRIRAPSAPSPQASTGLRRMRPSPQQPLVRLLRGRRTAWASLLLCVGVLGLAAIPVVRLDLGVGFTSSLPDSNPVSRASAAAGMAFAPGITSPTTILLEKPGVTSDVGALATFQSLIGQAKGVAAVIGPAQNFTLKAQNIVLARSGNAARMLVVFDHDPLDAVAIDDLTALRTQLPQMAARSGLSGARVSLGGDTALAEGLVSSTGGDLGRIAVAGILVNLLLLVFFLRALVAPLFLLASSVLALTASLGMMVLVFMVLGHHEGVTFYVPFAAAVLLVSLGSDYNIFGVGRVWEEARHLPLRAAVLKAVPESSRAITAAGMTLAVSFGMLAIIPLTPFRELAFAMTCGILIDAFLVRSLLVPALLLVVGPRSGWPGRALTRSTSLAPAALVGFRASVPDAPPLPVPSLPSPPGLRRAPPVGPVTGRLAGGLTLGVVVGGALGVVLARWRRHRRRR